MTYEIEGNVLLFQINRSEIIDIAVGDTIKVTGLPSTTYSWTEHDQQFIESNPDAELFLKIESEKSNGMYKPTGLILREKE